MWSAKRPFSADFAAHDDSSETNLQSSELLKHLLSEPIQSWRNYTELPEEKQILSSNRSEISLVSFIDDNTKNNDCQLLPGLTTKPPLPKKIDGNKTDAEKGDEVESNSSIEDGSGVTKKEALFENWITEEKEIESEILHSERQTDRCLDRLKDKEKVKAKFTATPIKSSRDTLKESEEVESWISKQPETPLQQNKFTYSDVLENLEDLEENDESVGRESSSSGVVEDNSTYEDIVSILKVLEDQDRKSRNFVK